MRKLIRNKRGVLGLDTVKSVIVGMLVLAVTAIAVMLALVSLNDAGIFTAGSLTANYSTSIMQNVTQGTTNFFKQVPTMFTILGVTVLILIVAIIIVAVSRFGGISGQPQSL